MGSTVTDFFSQIPVGIIVQVCISGVLLVVVMAYIVRKRVQRSQQPVAAAAPAKRKRFGAGPASAADYGDLPDIDMLVDTSTLATDAPAPEATVTAPAPPMATAARPAPAPARQGIQTVALGGSGGSAQVVEIVTILRDVTGGGLIIQMGDKAYRTLADDEVFKADFLKVMRELGPLVRGETPAPIPAAAPPAAEMAPQEMPPAEEDAQSLRELLAVREPKPNFPPPPPPPTSGGEMPGDLPRYTVDQGPVEAPKGGFFRRRKPDTQPVPDLDIAGAIEAYVQHKLQYTPELTGRSIHIHPSPDGGVVIESDGTFYEAVDDVTDRDVRVFLSTAIAEWQARLK